MAMNRELVGRTYAPSTYEVREEAMIKYTRATNETNPQLLEASSGRALIALSAR